MARRLTAFVHLLDADGERHSFGPDDEVPDWAARLITNPKAWQGDEEHEESAPVPPKHGAGSGREAWQQYAHAHGVEVPDDMGRDEIVSRLSSVGVPVD